MKGFTRRSRLSDVTAAILAGGLGTRLRPAVADRPKALAPVEGRPFLAHLLDRLAAAGLRKVVLLTGHRGDQVRREFGPRYGPLNLVYSEEPSPLGTGGAVREAVRFFDSQTILILNGDSYCRTCLAALAAFHERLRADVSLALARVDDAGRFGRVTTARDGRVAAFREKEGAAGAGWINAGIYLLERPLLLGIPAGRPVSLERELLPGWVRDRAVYGRRTRAPFLDIGTPDSYAAAADFLAKGPGVRGAGGTRTGSP